ncbi:MAG: hypothetical protein ACQXXL_00125 [Candidatus Methanosuratincola sp.]|nr:hypothetical protein [Candidatus Methanosuratincola sp.]
MSDRETEELAELKRSLEEKVSKLEKELALCRINLKLIDEALAKVSFRPASRLVEAGPKEEYPPPPPPPPPQPQPQPQAAALKPSAAQERPAVPAPAPEPAKAAAAPAAPPAISAARQQPAKEPEQEIGEEEQAFPIKSKTGEELGTIFVGRSWVRIVPAPSLHLNVRTPPFQTFFIDRVLGEMRRKDEMAVDAGSKDPMSIIEHSLVLDGESLREIRINNLDDDSRLREIRSSIRWTFERMLEKTKG